MPQTPHLPYGITRYYLPSDTGEPILARKRARPLHITAVTFLAVKPVPICTACQVLGGQRQICVNNLPKVVTWQCRDAESNLRPEQPQDYKFGTLPLDYQGTHTYILTCQI